MFGLGFMIRIFLAILAFVIFVLFTIGLAVLLSRLARFAWDAFERTFYDQAQWAIHKFHILKPWRFFTVPAITILLMLCCLATIVYALIAGSNLEGPSLQ